MTATTAEKPERYSEKRLKDSFTVYVLLSEPLQFQTSEILAAAREDYPGLSWTDDLGANMPFDTARVSLGVFWTKGETEPRAVHLTSVPGPCQIGWETFYDKARFTFPQARQAVERHRSYLCIDIPSVDQSLAARFDAARRVTCLGALFAKLPTCEAIYFPNGDTIVAPANWVKAADTAMKASVPLLQWVSICLTPMPDGKEPMPVSVQTVGVAAFTGYEIFMPLARIPVAEAATWVTAAATLVLERGHEFRDSDTLGMETGGPQVRIRHMPEGMKGAQTDMFALLHPKCTLNESEAFGPRTRAPAPAGVDNKIRGDENSLKNKLYSFIAGGKR